MLKRVIILLLLASTALGYWEISSDVPTVFSQSGEQQWRMWSGHDEAGILFDDSSGILFDDINEALIVGRFTPGDAQSGSTAVGYYAGAGHVTFLQSAFGNRAGYFNTGIQQSVFGWQAGYFNTGGGQTVIGLSAGKHNDGELNTALGNASFNAFTEDPNSASVVSAVNFPVNQVIIALGHGLGGAGTFWNLAASTTGTLPTGLTAGPDIWEVVDSTTLECLTVTFSDAGTGTHTLTPQFIYQNSTALGYNSEPDASNQIMLGDTNITEVKTTGSITAAGLTLSSLTDGRVVLAGTAGVLEDDSDLTFSGDTLTATEMIVINDLTTGGGRIRNTTRYTTTQTIPVTDDRVFCNTDSGAWVATLPAGVDGQEFRILNCGINNLTLTPDGAELLFGENSNFTLLPGDVEIITYEPTEGWK
jgi:hypothetical protein